MKLHDEELMVMYAAGHKGAFEMLFERYRDRIYRFALASLHNSADAEDVLQEVFLRLAKSAHRYQPLGKFKAWLFQIAANRVRTLATLRTRETVQISDYERHEMSKETEVFSDRILERDLLLKSLNNVYPAQRMVFLLRELEGFDYQTIARTLEISPENARTLHHRARQQAIQFLREMRG